MSDDDDVPQLVADGSQLPSYSPATAAPTASASASLPAAAPSVTPVVHHAYVRDPNAPPVPLTILTGFLGAGKTTLLTRIISHFASLNQSIAIIQNEASSFGVEKGLQLQDDSGAFNSLLELSNGCVCCSVKSDFVLGVEELLKRKAFTYIVLECSGLADPGPLAQVFWVDPELESSVYLDGIISVVDAKHFPRHLRSTASELESRQVIHQIAYADRIILNKMDLVSPSERDACLNEIKKINTTEVYCTARSNVEFDKILHIKAFDLNDTTRAVMPSLESVTSSAAPSSVLVDHPHDSTITTFMCDDLSVPAEQRRQVDLHRLKLWLEQLLWEDVVEDAETADHTGDLRAKAEAAVVAAISAVASSAPVPPASTRSNEIFRLKAIMSVQGEQQPTFLQGVQQLYDLQVGGEWPKQSGVTSTERFTRFVFIGRRLDQQALRNGYESIFAR